VIRSRDHQRGAATLAVVAGALALSVLAIGATTVGRLAIARLDIQRAADAAALTALALARTRGLPLDTAADRACADMAAGNTALPVRVASRMSTDGDALVVEITARAATSVPALLGGVAEVTAVARARLPQQRFDRIERHRPVLALALDYSGSMTAPFSGGQRRAIDVLEDAVASLLGAGLDIRYGAVFFGSEVFRSVPVGDSAPATIRGVMEMRDAGGETATGPALRRALEALRAAPDTGRHVLLVSYGEPCCAPDAVAQARAAATELWDAGATIFTLEIRRRGSTGAFGQLMTDLAGAPGRRGDRRYHVVAASAAELTDRLEDVVSTIVCTAGPLAAPADPATLRVYLDDGAAERAVPPSDDLARDAELERHAYDARSRLIRLSGAACDAVETGDAIVVRHGRARLAP
jgi:hypothetical protein